VNVFAETNFVLEVALEQQESTSCARLLHLAETRMVRLLLPAYSLVEPHEALTRRHLDREALRSRISSELTQLARSTPLAERAAASQEVLTLLVDSIEYETTRIEEVKRRMWAAADILPLDIAVLQSAADCRNRFDLSPQDAVVYASVRAYLVNDHGSPSCFVTRNPGDFDEPDLRRDLAALNCKFFSTFASAVQYVESRL
jgi:predicted nucleic acid-binding protein